MQTAIKRITLILITLFIPFSMAYGTVFTAVASGDWSAATTWGGNAPGQIIANGDQVIIPVGITVNLDNDVAVNAPTSSLEVSGTLNTNAGKSVGVNIGTLTGTGEIDIYQLGIASNGALLFSGKLTVSNLYTQGNSLALATMGTIKDTLSVSDGALTIQTGSGLTLENGATVMLSNGNLGNTGFSLASGGSANLYYSGSSDTVSGELMLSSINDVTVDMDNTSDELKLTSNLVVEGTLNVNNGTLNLNGKGMSLRSDLMMSTDGYLSAENSSISLKTSGSLSSAIKFKDGSDTLRGLTIEVGNGNEAKFESDVMVGDKFNLRSGTMNITGHSLALSGNITAEMDGELATDSQTDLWFTTNGTVTGAINFNASNNTVGNVVVDLGGSDSISFGSEVIIDGSLQLNNGNVAIGNNNLMLTANANIQGGSKDSYVQTEGSGYLSVNLAAGDSSNYPVGTAASYAGANIELNSSSSDGNYMVRAMDNVYAQGMTGTDISDNQSVVDHTWDVSTDASGSVDADLSLTWEGTAEVNSFDNMNAYISHYSNGSWDATAVASATANANGTFTLTRNNVSSFSPFTVFDESTSTGINSEFEASEYLELYPNPVNSTLHIDSEMKGATLIQIYSIDGRLVKQTELIHGHNAINLSKVEAGTYYLHIGGKNTGLTFVKQ